MTPNPKMNDCWNGITGTGIFQKLGAPFDTVGKAADIAYTARSGQKYVADWVAELFSTAPETALETIAEAVSSLYLPDWAKVLEAMSAEYNPIHNYDRTTTVTVTTVPGVTETKTTQFGHSVEEEENEKRNQILTKEITPATIEVEETMEKNLVEEVAETVPGYSKDTSTKNNQVKTKETTPATLEVEETAQKNQKETVTETPSNRTSTKSVMAYDAPAGTWSPQEQTVDSGSTATETEYSGTPDTTTRTETVGANGSETEQYSGDADEVNEVYTPTTDGSRTTTYSGQPDKKTHTETVGTAGSEKETYSGNPDNRTKTVSNAGQDTETTSKTGSDTQEYEETSAGNIGVTTTQQMLQAELALRSYNVFERIFFPQLDEFLTLYFY